MVDPLCCTAGTNTVKQLHANLKKKKKKEQASSFAHCLGTQ